MKTAAARTLLIVLLPISLPLLSFGQATAGPLRYAPKKDAKFAYEVEITADLPKEVETSKGIISFEVKSTGEIVKFVYSGGLHKTSKRKESARHEFPHPPMFPRHFGFGMSHRGLMHTTNRLSVTSLGKINALEGDSQLPYLLGDLSIFLFEPLPQNDQKSWTSSNPVSIFEESSSPFRRHRFPPFGGHNSDKRTAGSETNSFAFQSEKGDVSTFRKTYNLHSAEDKKSVNISGNGTWSFNKRLKMPESLDCKYALILKDENITLNLPVTVKCSRLSDEQLAKYEKEQKERLEKSKAEHAKRVAEQKAPLEGEKRSQILKDLKSNNVHTLHKALMQLARYEARDDKEIAKAIQRLLKHSSRIVTSSAADALVKFAPALEQKIKLNKAYSSIHNVEVTGPPIQANTPLPKGLIVAVNDFGPWYKAAKVIRKHKDGQVEVELNGFNQVKTHPYTKIRLAPPEVDQPYVKKRLLAKLYPGRNPDSADDDEEEDESSDEDTPATAGTSDRDYRTWTDDTGTFAIIAKYAGVDGKSVKLLRKKDGKEVKVPLARLSEDDRKMAERLMAAPKPDNPFE